MQDLLIFIVHHDEEILVHLFKSLVNFSQVFEQLSDYFYNKINNL